MVASIVADVKLNTSGLSADVGKVEGRLGKMASSTKSVFKGVLGANVVGKAAQLAAGGVQKLTGVLGESVDEAREAEAVGKTTAAIIKATGGAAKVSADQVGDLATSISNKTGIDDEAIQSGSNLLLTFKNVRNEAGEGANVFDRASAAAVDLSKAGFGSIEGGAKMLGKALNDPTKGISALGRAGVTFTDQQKQQIKTMQQSGDLLGAQRIILGEVESQVGGVAAANASAADKAKVMAGNLKEQFGTVLLPLLDKGAQFFTTTLGPAISKGIDMIGPAFSRISAFLGPIITQVQGALAGLFGGEGGAGGLLAQVEPIRAALTGVFSSVVSVAQTVLPIVVQVVGALIGAIRDNLPAITSAYQSISQIVSGIATIITTVWTKIGPTVLPILTSVFGTVVSIVSGALKIVAGIIKVISSVLTGDWRGAWEGIKSIVSGATQIVMAVVRNAAKVVGVVFRALIGVLGGIWGSIKSGVTSAWNGIVSTITSKVSSVLAKAKSIKDSILGVFRGAGDWLRDAGRRIIDGLISGIERGISRVRTLLSDVTDMIPDWKGPAERDSKLLIGAGRLIMDGLVRGLDQGESKVRAQLRALTTQIEGAVSPTIAPEFALATSGPVRGRGGAVVNNYTIEVDVPPTANPAEVGRVVVAAIEAYERSGGRRRAS